MKTYNNHNGSYKKLLKAPYQLISIMVVVVILVTNGSIYGLYKIGFEQQKKRLTEIVQSEAAMIKTIINYQIKMDKMNAPDKKVLISES